MKLRTIAIILALVTLASVSSIAMENFMDIERAYFQGRAKVFIFQPLPEGGIKLLKQGHLGGIVSLKTESKEWREALATKNLSAVPTPLIIYFTEDGKIGVKSFKPGEQIILEGMFPIEDVAEPSQKPDLKIPFIARIKYKVRSFLGTSSCPQGYEELNYRYCIIENWEYLKDSYYADSRTFIEWVPFMGVKVRSEGYKEIKSISIAWGIQLTTNMKSMWTLSVDGIPIIDFGESYSGSTLRVSYSPEEEIKTKDGYLDRYLNLPLKYVVVVYNVPVYDKLTKQYATIPIAGTYPIEIMLSGEYRLTESDLNRGYLLTNYLVSSHFPDDATSKPKVIRTNSMGMYPNLVFDFQGSVGYTFYSTPIGGSAASWIWSKLPIVGKLSITFTYSSTSHSLTTYNIGILQAAPNQLYYASILKRDAKLSGNDKVEVSMYFTTIDDG
ncbi:hypothetical protein PFDSM3638_02915 [Pyrococcus furiosus DSM 3638]|uniref:Uncharacterized protein n=4 Tax=Pyrococcus TaxID=2260 RepID=A0A5C0XN19_PYRFU|nr:hypothetical protein [Pyrococcus furiosus]AAL80705.1 hypothetical protein PF0581 [Pyrococcus furiosus DSM 3638]AFN03374.1 hypothetical protein PFC_02035 [Pyrococcus furiosus COM1]QEK78287.1 hypothetical protein PFDSM3638_02915 [Pyrococcus furiosus DSM 3638]